MEQEEKERKARFKSDGEEIINFFKENSILVFYHYTDSRNINSIIQNNGLYSLNGLIKRGIEFIKGSETVENPEYVRLSYTQSHPLMYVSENKGRITRPKILEIDIAVAAFRMTRFSNVNTARTSSYPTVITGDNLSFIRNHVKISIIKQNYLNLPTEEKPYYQAEILVREHVPLEHITNL